MTNEEMLLVAMKQSARDIGCSPGDFCVKKNVVVPYRPGNQMKKCISQPFSGALVSYGNNVVAAATDDLLPLVSEYVSRYKFYHCFETPNLHWLNERLLGLGQKVAVMAEYYLLDVNRLRDIPCAYQLRMLEPPDFSGLYLPEWKNALCADRKPLDVLCVGAYDGEALVGLAGCSADAAEMWQIGVDVLPTHRRKGIASALTARLAQETLERGKVPFYCTAWSNLRSVRNALKSGFTPAWAELTVSPAAVVDGLNEW